MWLSSLVDVSKPIPTVGLYQVPGGKWYSSSLSLARSTLVASSVGDLAIFDAAWNGTRTLSTVDIYNASSGRWTTTTTLTYDSN